ncbi:MAG: trehalose-6-phosphate synthase, partial [Terrabacter sp.]
MPSERATFDLVIAANRLPVDKVVTDDGEVEWRRSPGGLVTAMESVMRSQPGAWVGWAGDAGDAPEPFDEDGIHLHPIALSAEEVRDYYEGFSNDTLWPIYHDVIVPATFHREWWAAYQAVNERFAHAIAEVAAKGARVWVQDYQLQLVPSLVRRLRPDVRIGWFNHIPFPPVELFAQLPWRAQLLEGLLGADFLGFQRQADARNFVRACRQLLGASTKRDRVTVEGAQRQVRAAAIPISVDFQGLEELAKRPDVMARAREIRESLGNPQVLMLGVDRLDYTKGIRHRLKAYEELLSERRLGPPDVTLVQVATPSRERVEAYQILRAEIEQTVGRINGELGQIGAPTKGDRVTVEGAQRQVRAAAIPISVDFRGLEELARQPDVMARAREIRESLGNPQVLMLGVDRLDYTKGIRHRLKAFGELLADGRVSVEDVTLV